jgi:hypothetical protein
MEKLSPTILICLGGCLSIFSLASCSSYTSSSSATAIVPKGTRVLGLDTNNAAADFTFNQSFALAQSIGVSAGTVHLDWNTDEGAGSGATSGTFTDTVGQLASANAYYSAVGAEVSLTIAPIDTPGFELPSDLSGLPMNNANVITRFNAFMDWVLSSMPNTTFTSIQIGNEIDSPSAASTTLYWTEYLTFIQSVVAHLHSAKPGVKIGVTTTLYGLTGQSANGGVASTGILNLLSSIDDLGLTYYPLDSSFMVKNPSVVATDMGEVFKLVPSTPIYIQEAGYPTSSTCGGSEANQTSFVDQIFAAWDLHASQIPFVAFLRMNDLSCSGASSLAATYGLGGNAAFVAYLETLGFRTYSGSECASTGTSSTKPAWTELQNQAQLRGW